MNVNPMCLSDFLSVIDIVVTILIGFVITHIVSVRDSRTRAIKDYYIQELADIKSEINDFYSKLFKGELEAQDIIGWYTAIRNRVDIFDKAVRKTFRIYETKIANKLFNNHKFITNSDDFNSNYEKGKIKFKARTKIAIGRNQKQLYMLIERTLYDINNVRARDYIERKWLEFKSHYLYYRVTEKKTKKDACLSTALDWINTHKSSILVVLIILSFLYIFILNFGRFVAKEEKDSTSIELIQRIDSLNEEIRDISNKINDTPAAIELPSTYSIQLNQMSSTDTTNYKGWIKATK